MPTPSPPSRLPLSENYVNRFSQVGIVERPVAAGSIQGVKTDIARQDARDAKITLMEAYIQRQSGCLASEELSRAYKLPAGLIDVNGGSQASLVPVDTLMSQLQPSENHGPIPSQSIIAVIPSLYM
ncbi:hypothetical protein E4U47_003169 [Claviceps purpurea]|nr:hypothetical protein E4U47_003169 [Claviceps purpurea]KAG6290970.1 hypothetical protein E4U46_001458 [Claviceps purpurea]